MITFKFYSIFIWIYFALALILNFLPTVLLAVLSQAVKKGKELGFDIVLCDTSGRKYKLHLLFVFNELSRYISNGDHVMFSGLHTNYSLMEELISCKKSVAKVIPGAPNVSQVVYSFSPNLILLLVNVWELLSTRSSMLVFCICLWLNILKTFYLLLFSGNFLE